MEIIFGSKPTQFDSTPCILKYNSFTILLNPCISLTQLTKFPPSNISSSSKSERIPISLTPLSINLYPISAINCALVSNIQDLIGLCALKKQGFKGNIYCTHPVMLLGKEICINIFKEIKGANSEIYQNIEEISIQELEELFNSIISINFKEIINLTETIKIQAVSSGYELGSCNWIINIGSNKISYLSLSSIISYRYPQEFEFTELQNSDYFIVRDGILKENFIHTEIYDNQLRKLWDSINLTSHDSKAKMIMPMNLLQLLDMLDMFAYKVNTNIEVILLSEICDALIGYPNSCCEYLSEKLKQKILANDEAFSFKKLISNKQFSYYKNTSHLQKVLGEKYKPLIFQPQKIILTSHSSLRIGESPAILKGFLQESENVNIFLIDPLFCQENTIKPFIEEFKEKKPKIIINPLDPRISIDDFNKIIEKIKPKNIIIPENYYKAYFANSDKKYINYTENQILTDLKISPIFLPVKIDNLSFLELAKMPEKTKVNVKIQNNEIYIEKQEKSLKNIQELLANKISRENKAKIKFSQFNLTDFIEFIKKKNELSINESEKNKFEINFKENKGILFIENDIFIMKCENKELREILVKLYDSYISQ